MGLTDVVLCWRSESQETADGRIGMNIRELVGHRVRQVRESLGITQAELGERADLPLETVSRVERGLSVTLDNLWAIATALHLPLRELIAGDEPATVEQIVTDTQLRELVHQLEHADPKTVANIYKIARVLLEPDDE